jgi:hypothetical protein
VKQLAAAWPQAVQKPFALSFQVPVLLLPDCSTGSRVILPSGVKVILNFVPEGLAAVNGCPVKKVDRISAGGIGSAAKAAVLPKTRFAKMNSDSETMRMSVISRAREDQSRTSTKTAKRASNLALGLHRFQPPKQNYTDDDDIQNTELHGLSRLAFTPLSPRLLLWRHFRPLFAKSQRNVSTRPAITPGDQDYYCANWCNVLEPGWGWGQSKETAMPTRKFGRTAVVRFLMGATAIAFGVLIEPAQAQFVNPPPPPPPPVFNPSSPNTVPQPSYRPIAPTTPISPSTSTDVPGYQVAPATAPSPRRSSVAKTSPVQPQPRRHRIVVRPAFRSYSVVCGYDGCVRTYPWAFPCQYYSSYCGPLVSYRPYGWYRS